MIKSISVLLLCMVPATVHAVGHQGSPQIYALSGKHPDQVVMLSGWSEGKKFAEFYDDVKIAPRYFSKGRRVWTWCDGKSYPNTIENIETTEFKEITAVYLQETTNCNDKPHLMSNYEFPKQTWSVKDASEKDIQAIRQKLASAAKIKAVKIASQTKGALYLLFDPEIHSEDEDSYDGGYRLLDSRFNQISTMNVDALIPLIDLDNDGVPEFFWRSNDGLESFLWRMYPKMDDMHEIRRK
jgi:hypothetical protein